MPALKPGQAGFQGTIGNQYVGQRMWDPRGFYVIPNYGAPGRNLHIYPDGRKVLVKTPGTGAAPAAPAAPAAGAGAGAAAAGGAPPPDPTYLAEMLQLGRARDETISGLQAERGRTARAYGYRELGGGKFDFDPTDPYSRAALLKQTYDTSRRVTGQQLGAAGQMYGGAYQTAQDALSRRQLQGEDALQKSLTEWLAQNSASVGAAGATYGKGAITAAGEAAARAANAKLP